MFYAFVPAYNWTCNVTVQFTEVIVLTEVCILWVLYCFLTNFSLVNIIVYKIIWRWGMAYTKLLFKFLAFDNSLWTMIKLCEWKTKIIWFTPQSTKKLSPSKCFVFLHLYNNQVIITFVFSCQVYVYKSKYV